MKCDQDTSFPTEIINENSSSFSLNQTTTLRPELCPIDDDADVSSGDLWAMMDQAKSSSILEPVITAVVSNDDSGSGVVGLKRSRSSLSLNEIVHNVCETESYLDEVTDVTRDTRQKLPCRPDHTYA